MSDGPYIWIGVDADGDVNVFAKKPKLLRYAPPWNDVFWAEADNNQTPPQVGVLPGECRKVKLVPVEATDE
jgi:hypothetical protein